MIYGSIAIGYAVLITLIFGLMVLAGIVTATKLTVMVFTLIGLIPAVFLFLAAFLHPHDPVSSYIRGFANAYRRPLPVTPDDCTFKVRLVDGELMCVKISFFYPAKDRSSSLKDRLYTVVHGALTNDFASREVAPTQKEIEATLDMPLAALAEEHDIPVFYPEVREVYCQRDDAPAPVTFINTGTWS